MNKPRVTTRDLVIRSQGYNCPVCGSIMQVKNRSCGATYKCGSDPSCKGCHEWISGNGSQVNLRLVCSECGYEKTVLSSL